MQPRMSKKDLMTMIKEAEGDHDGLIDCKGNNHICNSEQKGNSTLPSVVADQRDLFNEPLSRSTSISNI